MVDYLVGRAKTSSSIVTGGGGYVGNRLWHQLVTSGYTEVTAIDVHFIKDEENGVDAQTPSASTPATASSMGV